MSALPPPKPKPPAKVPMPRFFLLSSSLEWLFVRLQACRRQSRVGILKKQKKWHLKRFSNVAFRENSMCVALPFFRGKKKLVVGGKKSCPDLKSDLFLFSVRKTCIEAKGFKVGEDDPQGRVFLRRRGRNKKSKHGISTTPLQFLLSKK